MTLNVNQYRWTVGVFSNRKLPLKKPHGLSLQKKDFKNSPNWNIDIPTCTYIRHAIFLNSAKNIRFLRQSLFQSLYFMSAILYIHYVWLYSLAIKLSGDIEEIPGPKPNSCDCLCICHWNLNSIPAHKFIKLCPLCAYISIN